MSFTTIDTIMNKLEIDLENAREALKIIDKYNRINNDLDAYLSEIVKWGCGEIEEKPNPKDYGLEEYVKP